MAFSILTRSGGGNEGVSQTHFETDAFDLQAGCSVAVAVVVLGNKTIVSVADTAGNTYTPIGAPTPTPGAGTSDPAGSFVQFYIANNTIADAANVVTATLSGNLTNCSIFAWQVYVDPKATPLGLDTNNSGSGVLTGAASPTFNTSSDNTAILFVGWKPSTGEYMSPSGDQYFATYGGYLNASHTLLTTQQDGVFVYFASSAGFVEIFTLALQANDISAVVADHPGGNYGAAVDVALSLDYPRSGVEIRYTLDGTTPTSGSTLYTTPIHIASTKTLKAKGFDAAGRLSPGPLMTETYTFGTVNVSAVSVDTVPGGDGSSLVASWTTNVVAYSFAYADDGHGNIFSGNTNNYDVQGTSHEVVICGLTPGTPYSVTAESGGVVSSPVVATTRPAPTRGSITAASIATPVPTTDQGKGDIYSHWIGADGIAFVGQDDAEPLPGIPQGANLRVMKFLTPSAELHPTFANVNFLTNFGIKGSSPRSDGYNGETLTYKQTGLLIMNGKIFLFESGQRYGGAQYCLWPCTLMSEDGGATWNNAFDTATFDPDGNVPPERNFLWRDFERGWVAPVIFAPDDGTLGQRNAANAFDGGNGYVYMIRHQYFLVESLLYFGRQPRPLFEAQSPDGFEWWAGGVPPTPTANAFFNDAANWSKNNTDSTPIVDDTNLCGGSYMAYVPGPNCYIFITCAETAPGSSDQTTWTVRTGPTPAGPWTMLAREVFNLTAFYGPVLRQRDVAYNAILNGDVVWNGYTTNNFNDPTMYYPSMWQLTVTLDTPLPPPPPPASDSGSGGGSSSKGRKGVLSAAARLSRTRQIAGRAR